MWKVLPGLPVMQCPRHPSPIVIAIATIVLLLAGRAFPEPAPSDDSPFVAVFIDAKTEKALGPFPYDRSVLAKAINKASASGARGVVLKLFIDREKTAEGDRALVAAAKATKLIVQARIDEEEKTPNPLPDRFALQINAQAASKTLEGKSGWIPLPEVAAAAHDLGFIDYRQIDRMPMIERYRGKVVKSLYLCCLELALGEQAQVVPGESVRLGGKTIKLDERSEIPVSYPANDDLRPISFSDFIDQPARPELKDRIVIIGYDSDRFKPVDTRAGKIRPHRAFIYALLSIYRQFR